MKKVVISLGGSIVVPDKVDSIFIKKFKKLIMNFIENGNKVIIVVGGGTTARRYIESAKDVSDYEKDWIGIMATRLNAQVVRATFGKDAHDTVIIDPLKKITSRKKIIIGAGYKPGWSTDYVATLLAKNIGAKKIINLSNIYYVFDKDPSRYKSAKRIEYTDWKSMQDIVGTKWEPGLNAPFDPIATKLCRKIGLEVIITKGTDLVNLRKILNEKKAKCTVIR